MEVVQQEEKPQEKKENIQNKSKLRFWVFFIIPLVVASTTIAATFLYFDLFSKKTFSITIPENYTHEQVASGVAAILEWPETSQDQLIAALQGIKWDAFNKDLLELLGNRFDWNEQERELFLTQSTLLLSSSDSILENIYIPGEYELNINDTPANIAEKIVERVQNEGGDILAFLDLGIDKETKAEVQEFINEQFREKYELLPDLIPLPAQDLALKRVNGRDLLVFSTTYYNIGRGNLELIADPETTGFRYDMQRIVFQRIYKTDGEYRDRPAGTFLWHQEHLHYHFADFIEYRLETASGTGGIKGSDIRQKSTFCIRDVSRITLNELSTTTEAQYLICGKEKQGVTVGWGDTYFSTYPDQNLDVTNITSGTYTLTFDVNPLERFDEITRDNNMSSVTFELDKKLRTVTMLETSPEDLPEFEHIYIEQVF